ncbi:hypothetical protein BDB00DRAFT_51774 [Zychaea mexicana]|uniref:uncharacterized protein n=1 Tax=Zychaea mexicana TaxID=64656 RepID=UPI0022FF1017|nr:uncharacterized protein BDB00DRAFT_51774 [Zychaea mexicana]KAI9497048.1 hypothetical protein BDB00DRAFT_51774 [Zychaea mexicana]
MEDTVEKLDRVELDDDQLVSKRKFISSILSIFAEEVYVNVGVEVLQKSETIYRSYVFDPCLKNVAKYLRRTGYQITFLPGEIELNAITKQLQHSGMKDGRYHYKADGMLRADEFPDMEILLTEVSNGYGSNSTGKSSFDHYKAINWLLKDRCEPLRFAAYHICPSEATLLQSYVRNACYVANNIIAQKYSKASLNTFRTLKVHFLHGHGDAVRHWSMSVQAPGVFVMNKEQRAEVPVNFTSF